MTSALCLVLAAALQLAPPDTSVFLERGTIEFSDDTFPVYSYRLWELPGGNHGVFRISTTDGGAVVLPSMLASSFAQIHDKHFGDAPSVGFGWDVIDGVLVVYVQQTVGVRTAWLYGLLAAVLAVAGGAGLWWRRRRAVRRAQREVHAHQIESREAERARVAREIHDGPLQELAVLTLGLDAADGPDAVATREGLREVARELRTIAEGLRPPVLDQFGLARALHDLTDRAETGPQPLAVEVRAEAVPLGPEAELALYRVAQEALTNAARHGRATRATVTLATEDGSAVLTVRDDGQGLGRQPSFEALVRRGHFGLAGMRERVRLVGGALEIADAPGGGAVLTARVPAAYRGDGAGPLPSLSVTAPNA